MVTAAPAARAFRKELTRRFPGRSEASDGILPSALHSQQNPDSRHELGNAVDATHDPDAGCDMYVITEQVRQRCIAGWPVVDEIIWQGRICTAAKDWRWRARNRGSGDHVKHAHFSIVAAHRNDTGPWLPEVIRPQAPEPTPLPEDLTVMDKDTKAYLDARFGAIDARLTGLEGDVVTILRGPNHPSLTRILDGVSKIRAAIAKDAP